MQREAADRGHDLGPVDERDTFLRLQLDALQARGLQGVPARTPDAVRHGLALAHEHERRVREGREVA